MRTPNKVIVLIYAWAIFIALVVVSMAFAGRHDKRIEHADLVLDERGCRWLKQLHLREEDSDEPKTCRLEDVSVASRGVEGESGYLGITEIQGHDGEGYSIKKEDVLWIEQESDGVPIRVAGAAFGD